MLFIAAALLAPALQATPPDSILVLRGGQYLDVRTGRLRANGAIVVRDGKITAIRPAGAPLPPMPGARVVDLPGHTILPGLIDAHVHLTLGDDPAANAAATLQAGFTTVVDLGSAGGAGVELRDRIVRGEIPGPTIVAAGSWIGTKGGVCEFGGATVSNPAEARERAVADLKTGADLLKVCVTGWPAAAIATPDSIEFGGAALDSVLSVARSAGKPVYAHAIGQAGALLTAGRGVRALAHTPVMDSAAALKLKRSGVPVISTLTSLGSGKDGEAVRRSFALLRAARVPIVLGTDAGVLTHGENAKEVATLVEAGLSPAEAIRAGTIAPAALIGRQDLGEIKVGAVGDLLVVEGNPLLDPTVLQRPAMVVKSGHVVPTAMSR